MNEYGQDSAHDCWDLPDKIDFKKLSEEMDNVTRQVQSAASIPNVAINTPSGCGPATLNIKPVSSAVAGEGTDYSPVVVVVEGFLLFHNQDIVRRLDHLIWLDLSPEKGALRRFIRAQERGLHGVEGDATDSDPNFRRFRNAYIGHTYAHHLDFKSVMLENVRGTNCKRVDADQDVEDVLTDCMCHIRHVMSVPGQGVASRSAAELLAMDGPAEACGKRLGKQRCSQKIQFHRQHYEIQCRCACEETMLQSAKYVPPIQTWMPLCSPDQDANWIMSSCLSWVCFLLNFIELHGR
jgi:hypothetical protein